MEKIYFSMEQQCLFCLKLEKADKSHSSLNSTWFKMLMRYLHMDESSTLDKYLVGNSENLGGGGVFICEKCGSLGNEFWEWYEHFETIRLRLDRCIRSLLDILKNKTCPEDLSSLPMEYSELRSLTIRKCLSKIGSSPKVLLEGNIASHHHGAADSGNYELFTMQGDIDPFICSYCLQKFKDKNDLRAHLIVQHPFEFHSKDLPHGITLEQGERDKAIQTALRRHRRHPKNLKLQKGIDCLTCSRHITSVCNFREHFLMYHFSEVVDLLRTTIVPSLLPSMPTEAIPSYPVLKQELPLVVSLPQVKESCDIIKQGKRVYKFSCNLCPRAFRTQKTLQSHQKMSNGNPKRCHLVTCSICGKDFTSKMTCWRHWKSHNPHEGRNASVLKGTCKYCGKIFRDTYKQRDHEVCFHPFQFFAQKLPPSTTEAKLKEGITLTIKKIQEINKQQDVLQCCRCVKQFKTPYSLRPHILQHHFDLVLKVLKDNTVGLVEDSKIMLWRHQNRKCSSLLKIVCSYCGKLYKQMWMKRNHEIISHTFHHFANKLPPQTTERKLKEAINITRAKQLNHEKNKNWKRKEFIGCVTCGSEFLVDSLRAHILLKHFDQVVEVLKDKDFLRRGEETFSDNEEVIPSAVKEEAEIYTTEVDIDLEDEIIIPYNEDPAEGHGDCKGVILNSFSLANNTICDGDLDANAGEDVILGC